MDAKKCDRCGAFYEKYGNKKQANIIKVLYGDYGGYCPCDRTIELCPECMKGFEKWYAVQNESIISISEVCKELAQMFESPCDFSPIDDFMCENGDCEDCCGKLSDAECWERYFKTKLKEAQ